MALKIIISILIFYAVLMGTQHGWNILTANPEILEISGN